MWTKTQISLSLSHTAYSQLVGVGCVRCCVSCIAMLNFVYIYSMCSVFTKPCSLTENCNFTQLNYKWMQNRVIQFANCTRCCLFNTFISKWIYIYIQRIILYMYRFQFGVSINVRVWCFNQLIFGFNLRLIWYVYTLFGFEFIAVHPIRNRTHFKHFIWLSFYKMLEQHPNFTNNTKQCVAWVEDFLNNKNQKDQ